MDYQLQQSQLWEKHLQDDAYGVPTQHQLYCHECRFARVWVPHRQQMSNAMVNYTMDTKCVHSLLSICKAFVNISAKRSKGKSTVLGSDLLSKTLPTFVTGSKQVH